MSTTLHYIPSAAGGDEGIDEEREHPLAGWYAALDPLRDRYWDGSGWTERYRDRSTPRDLPPQPSPSGRPAVEPKHGVSASVLALSTAAALVLGVLLGGAAGVFGLARAVADVTAAHEQASQVEERADLLRDRLEAVQDGLRGGLSASRPDD